MLAGELQWHPRRVFVKSQSRKTHWLGVSLLSYAHTSTAEIAFVSRFVRLSQSEPSRSRERSHRPPTQAAVAGRRSRGLSSLEPPLLCLQLSVRQEALRKRGRRVHRCSDPTLGGSRAPRRVQRRAGTCGTAGTAGCGSAENGSPFPVAIALVFPNEVR